jgi:integrase/recombinase XerD
MEKKRIEKYTSKDVKLWVNEWIRSRDIAITSQKTYRNSLNVFWNWYLRKRKTQIAFPKLSDIKQFRSSMYKKHRSYFSVDSYLYSLRLFFSWMYENFIINENPMNGFRIDKRKKEFKRRPLNDEQATMLLNSFDKSKPSELRDYTMVLIMLIMGFRRVELVRMCIGDLHGSELLVQGKGEKSKNNSLNVPASLLMVLNHYLAQRKYKYPQSPFFPSFSNNSQKRPISENYISGMVKSHLRQIGVNDPNISCHSLRHSCGFMLMKEGHDIHDVQIQLRHNSIDTTKMYVSMIDKELVMTRNNITSNKIIEKLTTGSHSN